MNDIKKSVTRSRVPTLAGVSCRRWLSAGSQAIVVLARFSLHRDYFLLPYLQDPREMICCLGEGGAIWDVCRDGTEILEGVCASLGPVSYVPICVLFYVLFVWYLWLYCDEK